MYKCLDCGETFEKPLETDLDIFYGVASEFNSLSGKKIELCPNCESNNFTEKEEDSEETYLEEE